MDGSEGLSPLLGGGCRACACAHACVFSGVSAPGEASARVERLHTTSGLGEDAGDGAADTPAAPGALASEGEWAGVGIVALPASWGTFSLGCLHPGQLLWLEEAACGDCSGLRQVGVGCLRLRPERYLSRLSRVCLFLSDSGFCVCACVCLWSFCVPGLCWGQAEWPPGPFVTAATEWRPGHLASPHSQQVV